MPIPDLPEIPASLKSIQPYLKIANEHDQRDPVVSYWARLYALQTGMKLSSKGPEERNFLIKLMDWMETSKKEHHDNEAISNEVAAQAHLENWALKLFLFADKNDRAGNFTKNVIQSFYTAGLLYDVLTTFGELTDEAMQNRKYAKWKAAYIHNCLKNGETPVPGPVNSEKGDDDVSPKPDEELDNSDDDNQLEKPDESENPAEAEVQPEASDNPDQNVEEENDNAGGESEPNDESNEPEEAANECPPEPASDHDDDDDDDEAERTQPTPPSNAADPYGFPSPPGTMSPSTTPQPAPSSIPPYPSFSSDTSIASNPQPYNPPSTTPNTTTPLVDYSSSVNTSGVSLTPEQMTKVAKYIKFAGSAVNYDDVPTAVQNLQKALHLLTTGQDS